VIVTKIRDPEPGTDVSASEPPGESWEVPIVVPLFCPPPEITERLRALATMGPVVAVDDGSPTGYEPILETVNALPRVHLIRSAGNRGIGSALNIGIRECVTRGARVVVTFDQDSSPSSDHVRHVLDALSHAGPDAGVLGPGRLDGEIVDGVVPGLRNRLQPVTSLIQSGMAIPTSTWHTVGEFDEPLFIDMVDIDYCLRVRAAGLDVVAVTDLDMAHCLGLGPDLVRSIKVGRYRPRATGHGPDRRYYMTRNLIVMLRRHARREPRWALIHTRRILAMNLLACTIEEHRLRKLLAITRGLVDGLLGRSGRRPGGHLWRKWNRASPAVRSTGRHQ